MQPYRYRWRNILPILIRRYHEIPLLIYEKWNAIAYLCNYAQYLQKFSPHIPRFMEVCLSSVVKYPPKTPGSIVFLQKLRVVLVYSLVCLFAYVFPAKLLYSSFGHVFCVIKKSFLPPFYGVQSFISVSKEPVTRHFSQLNSVHFAPFIFR